MSDIAIKIQGLTKRFGELTAVDNLSLEIPRGIVFGFLGPNGAGKTTTIRLLLGLSHPTKGKALVQGHDPATEGEKVREICGALLENTGLYERLSSLDNLKYFAEIYHIASPEKEERIESLLRHIELWERRHDKVKDWSKGMKQKLALCRTILHKPQILFLDEPTIGLDVPTSMKIRQTIRNMAENEGCTVFYTSHNLGEVEQLCHRVGIIHKGRLIAEGSPGELKAGHGGRKLRITGESFSEGLCKDLRDMPCVQSLGIKNLPEGTQSIILIFESAEKQALNDILQKFLQSGATVNQMDEEPRSLETAFLELTGESTSEN